MVHKVHVNGENYHSAKDRYVELTLLAHRRNSSNRRRAVGLLINGLCYSFIFQHIIIFLVNS